MARKKAGDRVEVDDYRHEDATRMNNPPVGLAHHDTDTPPVRNFAHDPHLDPELSWTGKAERQGFEVEAPSIHVHERMSAEAIVTSAQRRSDTERDQMSLFADERIDHTKTLDFYQHELDWENRFILGDSLVVMTSLLERERLGERVQCIYIDPPYGVNFNSNFQARMSDRTPKETSDGSLTREPEQIQAYRDTWELGIHSYLTYLRDRLLVARELLAETGSVFVQIGEDNLHLVRILLDEVFGPENHVATISAQKSGGLGSKLLTIVTDYLVWYAVDKPLVKFRPLYRQRDERSPDPQLDAYSRVELVDGTRRRMTREERANPELLPTDARRYRLDNLRSQGFRPNTTVDYEFEGRTFHPGPNNCWKTTVEGLDRLTALGRLEVTGNTLSYVRFAVDSAGVVLNNLWTDTSRAGFGEKKRYVVETTPKIVARAILMASDPGDLVLDPTCGSGTTAYVCEQYGRRWITADTSRVAIALAKERLLTAKYPYYRLLDEGRGVDGGFAYHAKERVTLGSLANEEKPEEIAYYDDPKVDPAKVRVSGPFTYEALSRYSINPVGPDADRAETATNRAAAADHVTQLLDALQAQGIPRPEGDRLGITSLERIAGTGPLHAEGTYETDGEQKRFAVALGPRFGTITPTQVDDALREAYGYDLVVFAGFAAHAETQALLEKGRLGRYDVALLMANPDLLLGSLLKKTTASQTFRLYASPDVTLRKANKMWAVAVNGVDAYDAATGNVTSASQANVRAWFLDTDYDGMVFRIDQAFFPHASSWDALAKALKGTVDEGALDDLAGFNSIPFDAGDHKRCAVRVLTDDGNAAEVILALNGARS